MSRYYREIQRVCMSNKTVSSWLSVSIYVTCPNDDCSNLIDLMDETDTNGTLHDDDSDLTRQVYSDQEFKCDDVICTECKTQFNVREMTW